MLRGSRGFPDLESYEDWVREVVERRLNRRIAEALALERQHLRPLPTCRVPDYSRYQPIVRRWSTIRIGRRAYSVPSRLIGHRVEVRQHAPRLEDAGYEASLPTLLEFFELEREARWVRRLARLRKASKLPPAKSFDTFDDARLPRPLARQLRELARGDFLERAVNVLAFGLPGTGKSHAACALGHPLVDRGHSVLWRAQTRTSTTVLET